MTMSDYDFTDTEQTILVSLGIAHGIKGVSSLTAAQIAEGTDLSSQKVAQAIRQHDEGVIVRVNPEAANNSRYALRGSQEENPYRVSA